MQIELNHKAAYRRVATLVLGSTLVFYILTSALRFFGAPPLFVAFASLPVGVVMMIFYVKFLWTTSTTGGRAIFWLIDRD